jgi:hypothetical protein
MVGQLERLARVAQDGVARRYRGSVREYFTDAIAEFRAERFDAASDDLLLANDYTGPETSIGACAMALAIIDGTWDGAYYRLGSAMLRKEGRDYVVSTTYFVGIEKRHCDHWRGLSYRDAVAVFGSMVSSEAQESGRGSLDRAARALATAEGVVLTMRRAS